MGEAATILYRDADLVAVDKPPGRLVHRSRIDAHDARPLVQAVRDAIGARVWPVHRLDRGTSGALLFALDAAKAATLGEAFASGRVAKRYVALVRGWPPPVASVDHPLAPRGDDAEGMTPEERAAAARPAVTDFVRLATAEVDARIDRYARARYALVEARPRTGRRHQIRRHLKHAAHPVIGDATYGKGAHNRFIAVTLGTGRLWLHARALRLEHPSTGAPLHIAAPFSGEWQRLWAALAWRPDPPPDDDAALALAALLAAE